MPAPKFEFVKDGERNVHRLVDRLKDYFSPKVIGEVNDAYVKVTKVLGDDVPWHSHDNEDELFYIIKGSMTMFIEGEDSFVLGEGDYFVVPRGVRHRVNSEEECGMILVENKSTQHTGDVASSITRSVDDQVG